MDTDVAIIGAGLTGLSTAAGLKRSGIRNFVVLERTDPAVGSWRDDTMGLFGLREHVLTRHEVVAVSYDAVAGRWAVTALGKEQISARSVVLATGASVDGEPAVPGLENYAGTVVHGQEFRELDLAGKRVAVVGNGAAAATLLPEIVRKAQRVKLFQSSPDWVLPRRGPGLERLLHNVPALRDATRQAWFWGRPPQRAGLLEMLAQRNLRRHVQDAWTRRQLTPLPLTGRPSVVVADDFYAALQAPNCKFISWPLVRFSPGGIRTAEGIEHLCDVIVFASAPDAGRAAQVSVTGPGGQPLPATGEIAVPGFPDLFQADPPLQQPGREAVQRTRSRVDRVVARVKGAVADRRAEGVLPASRRTRFVVAVTAIGLRPVINSMRLNAFGVTAARQFVAGTMAVGSPMPAGVEVTRVRDGAVRGEWVRAANVDARGPVILYLHGSGYVVCSAATHRRLVARLSRETGLPAFSVDYRLAPEHRFPAAADDTRVAYQWLLGQGYAAGDIVIAGDSAGGHLAMDLVAENSRLGIAQPGALVLFSPLADPTLGLSAEREREAPDPLIAAAAARRLVDQYTRDERDDSPRLRLAIPPGTAVPPTLIQVGGREMMVADAEHLELMITRAGGQCELQVWPGQVHVFQALPRFSAEASAALREAGRFVTETLVAQTETTAQTA